MTLDYANEMVVQFLKDAREPDYPHLVDIADLFGDSPTDIQLLDALVEAFDTTAIEMVERLACMDVATLRKVVMQAGQQKAAA